jgi:hypothetical protein
MKKLLLITALAAGLGAGALLISSADADVITDTVNGKSKEDLLGPEEVKTPDAVPIIDTQKVEEVILDLREVEKNRGLLGIARKRGLTFGQVKAIDKAVKKRLMEIAEAEAGP